MALRYENRRFFFQGILHAAQYVYLNESQTMSSPRISKTNDAMVGILLYIEQGSSLVIVLNQS